MDHNSSPKGRELSPAQEARGQSFNLQTWTTSLLGPCPGPEADSEIKPTQEYTNMVFYGLPESSLQGWRETKGKENSEKEEAKEELN